MTTCVGPRAVGEQRLRRFRQDLERERVPVEGSFALTHGCNLRCAHCYLGPALRAARSEPELATAEVCAILDQLAEAGTLFLTFTGGEPTLRPDFELIWTHAARHGMLLTLFTNATALRERHLDLLREIPPLEVEVTFHGVRAETFDAMTGVAGSHALCLAGIQGLADHGIRFALKTVLVTTNVGEIDAIEEYARALGVPMRYDTAIFPPLASKPETFPSILSLRLSPEEAARIDTATERRRAIWSEHLADSPPADHQPLIYPCSAGLTSFHIDATGRLSPCVIAPETGFSLRRGSFLAGWRERLGAIRLQTARQGFRCTACTLRGLCLGCPAAFALETGAPDCVAEYHCRSAHARFAALLENQRKEDSIHAHA